MASDHSNAPVGNDDIFAGSVVFIIVALFIYFILDVSLPGFLTWKAFIQIVVSGGLFLFIWTCIGQPLFEPYFQVLEERELQTVGNETATLEKRAELAKVESEIQSELQQARIKGLQLKEALITEAKTESSRKLEETHSKEMAAIGASREELQKLEKEAFDDLEKQAKGLSKVMMESIIEV